MKLLSLCIPCFDDALRQVRSLRDLVIGGMALAEVQKKLTKVRVPDDIDRLWFNERHKKLGMTKRTNLVITDNKFLESYHETLLCKWFFTPTRRVSCVILVVGNVEMTAFRLSNNIMFVHKVCAKCRCQRGP